MTCAKLVGLNSPVLEFIVTFLRFSSAFTVVKRILQSLYTWCSESAEVEERLLYLPLLFDHFQKVAVIYYALKDGAES